MSSQLIFYTHPMSRGRVVRWMLEELNTSYETSIISYAETGGSDELLADDVCPHDWIKSRTYLKINPMGKVPALRHNKTIITETAAICAYLADTFPNSMLAPSTISERGLYYRWLFFAAGPLEAAITNKMFGFEVTEKQQSMVGYGSIDRVIHTVESALRDNKYIVGKRFSAADVYVGSHLDWTINVMKTIPNKPVFAKYVDRLKKRAAYLHANELDNALLKGSGTL